MSNPSQAPETVSKPQDKQGGRKSLQVVLFLLFIAVLGLFIWAEQQRRDAIGRLEATEQKLEEIQKSTQQNGEERAKEILEKVKSHIVIPDEPKPTIATIVDVDRLRETSDFYKNAANGDVLIITADRAILYNPNENFIIDVVPIRTSPAPSATPQKPTTTP